LLEDGERALHDVAAAAAFGHALHRIHRLVEAHAEIRVVERDEHLRPVLRQVAQVVRQVLARERHVFAVPVDAEIAGVGAADAGQHRHHAGDDRPAAHESGGGDLGHPLFDRGQGGERPTAGDQCRRIEAPLQDVVDQRRVAIADDEVEEAQRIDGK
jgi:hypothetical protein